MIAQRLLQKKYVHDCRKLSRVQQRSRQKLVADELICSKVEAATVMDTLRLLRPTARGVPLRRVGSIGDGGYLIPEDISFVDGCFSPGVGGLSEFEFFLAEQGIQSFMADASVDGPARESKFFDFEKKFLGVEDSANFMRLDTWVAKKLPDASNLILQIDIEGDEWGVLLDADESLLAKFAIVVIEFHDLHLVGATVANIAMRKVLEKLDHQFAVCYIHPNNYEAAIRIHGLDVPPVLEATYIRKDLLQNLQSSDDLGLIPDWDNSDFMPSLRLSDFWQARESSPSSSEAAAGLRTTPN